MSSKYDAIFDFEQKFCQMVCPEIDSCDHVCQAEQCEMLHNALVDEGLIIDVYDTSSKGSVNIGEMQRDIMVELINARKDATDRNTFTADGMVAVIDALFYLVQSRPVIPIPGGIGNMVLEGTDEENE